MWIGYIAIWFILSISFFKALNNKKTGRFFAYGVVGRNRNPGTHLIFLILLATPVILLCPIVAIPLYILSKLEFYNDQDAEYATLDTDNPRYARRNEGSYLVCQKEQIMKQNKGARCICAKCLIETNHEVKPGSIACQMKDITHPFSRCLCDTHKDQPLKIQHQDSERREFAKFSDKEANALAEYSKWKIGSSK